MKCKRAQQAIALYVTGDLDYNKAEAVKEHIITCDACSEDAESYRQSLQTLSLLKNRTMPAEFWDGYWEELHERIHADTSHPRRANRVVRVLSAAAAAAVLALAVMVAWPWLSGGHAPPGTRHETTVHSRHQPPEESVVEVDYYMPSVVDDVADTRYAADEWRETYETPRADDF